MIYFLEKQSNASEGIRRIAASASKRDDERETTSTKLASPGCGGERTTRIQTGGGEFTSLPPVPVLFILYMNVGSLRTKVDWDECCCVYAIDILAYFHDFRSW